MRPIPRPIDDSEAETIKAFDPDPQVQIDIEAIYDYLLARFSESPHETVPYGALTHILGRDVREYCRHAMSKARALLCREHKMLIRCHAGVGLYRADNDGVVDSHADRIKRVRGQAKRLITESVAFDDVTATDDQRMKYLASQNLAGTYLALSSSKARKKVEEAMAISPTRLPMGKTLELFVGKRS